MKNVVSVSVLILALLSIGIVAGMKLQLELLESLPEKRTVTIVERKVYLPAKVSRKPAVRDTSGSREDSVKAFVAAQADSSVRAQLEHKSGRFTSTFEDTVAYADSTGSFWIREVHAIAWDGLKELISKSTTYPEARISSTKETVEKVSVPKKTWFQDVLEWAERIGTFLLGVLTGRAL